MGLGWRVGYSKCSVNTDNFCLLSLLFQLGPRRQRGACAGKECPQTIPLPFPSGNRAVASFVRGMGRWQGVKCIKQFTINIEVIPEIATRKSTTGQLTH